jgi:hypothetical protein
MPRGGTIGNKGGTGRPVTVGGSADVHVRVSPEMHDKLLASAAAAHVSLSESVRLVLALIADSPADMLAAMVADPEAARTVFVERMRAPGMSRRVQQLLVKAGIDQAELGVGWGAPLLEPTKGKRQARRR